MKPHLLIKALVDRAGGALPVAVAMKAKTFQGTLWKICSGLVVSPARASADRIAKHFGIPLEAIYSEKVAADVWLAEFGGGGTLMRVRPAEYTPAARELAEAFDALPEDTLEAIDAKQRLHQTLLYLIGLHAAALPPTALAPAPAAPTTVGPPHATEKRP